MSKWNDHLAIGLFVGVFLPFNGLYSEDLAAGPVGFKSQVPAFSKTNCIKCHGPEKSKGKMTLYTLDGNLNGGHQVEQWEKILEAVSGVPIIDLNDFATALRVTKRSDHSPFYSRVPLHPRRLVVLDAEGKVLYTSCDGPTEVPIIAI